MKTSWFWLRFLLAALILAWVFGFGWFTRDIRAIAPAPTLRTDAIVVLTGGSGRIGHALELMRKKRATRLLITGAHPQTTLAQLAAQYSESGDLFSCCIDLGHVAGDTIGNAAEAASWVEDKGFASVRLVTSDYHMPRSLLEFRARLPQIVIVPDAVAGHASPVQLIMEYSKYVVRLSWLWLQQVAS